MPCARCGRWARQQWIHWLQAPSHATLPNDVLFFSYYGDRTHGEHRDDTPNEEVLRGVAWFYCVHCRDRAAQERSTNGRSRELLRRINGAAYRNVLFACHRMGHPIPADVAEVILDQSKAMDTMGLTQADCEQLNVQYSPRTHDTTPTTWVPLQAHPVEDDVGHLPTSAAAALVGQPTQLKQLKCTQTHFCWIVQVWARRINTEDPRAWNIARGNLFVYLCNKLTQALQCRSTLNYAERLWIFNGTQPDLIRPCLVWANGYSAMEQCTAWSGDNAADTDRWWPCIATRDNIETEGILVSSYDPVAALCGCRPWLASNSRLFDAKPAWKWPTGGNPIPRGGPSSVGGHSNTLHPPHDATHAAVTTRTGEARSTLESRPTGQTGSSTGDQPHP